MKTRLNQIISVLAQSPTDGGVGPIAQTPTDGGVGPI